MLDPAVIDRLLRFIWLASLALASTGFLVMVGLVVRRYLQELRDRRLEPGRDQARRGLLMSLQGNHERGLPPVVAGLPRGELAELIDEIAQMVRGEPARRLAEIGRAAGIEAMLQDRLVRGRPAARREAARRLALFADQATREVLHAALDDRDGRVRLAAARALLTFEGEVAPLARRLLADPITETQPAKSFLHELAARDPDLLAAHAADEASPARLTLIIEALAATGLVALVPTIAAFAGHAEAPVRVAVLRGLAGLGHPRGRRLATEALSDAAPAVRLAALRLLASAPRPAEPALITRLVADPDPGVRRLAAEIMARHAAAEAARETRPAAVAAGQGEGIPA